MDYPRQVSLRISHAQFNHCLNNGGITKHIRRLLEVDMGIDQTELEKMVAIYMKKYASQKAYS